VERELALLTQYPSRSSDGAPRGSIDEQTSVLEMAKEVISALKEPPFITKLSTPVLWHTDLHTANIFVSEEDPTTIVSLIDWQALTIAPLFLKAQFPDCLPVEEDYVLGSKDLPKLPRNYEDMDAGEKEVAEYQLQQAKLAKGWEMSTMAHNTHAYKALYMPSHIRELFLRAAVVGEEGDIPLRARLIELAEEWNELGVTAPCPVRFNEGELERHERQFREWKGYQDVGRFARRGLGTDFEGWVSPYRDFEGVMRGNERLLGEAIGRGREWGMRAEEVRGVWPFKDGL
jgi:hypothetical protein